MALLSPQYMDCVVAVGVDNPNVPNKVQWVGTGFLFGYRVERTLGAAAKTV